MTESELLTRSECQDVFERALGIARPLGVRELEVTLDASDAALTRFANNTIHQNVAERRRAISVRAAFEGRTARASANRLDVESIRRAVEDAVALTRAAAPDPELPEMAEPAALQEVDRYCPSTARSAPEDRAEAVAQAIRMAEAASLTAAGIYSASESAEAVLNSRGVFAYYFDTLAQFSITAMGEDSSGWAKASAPDCGEIDPLALTRRACEKAAVSRGPRELAPGRYTVILEPAAVQDLLGQMFFDFSATALRDQRGFLTGRIGQRLFGEGVHIADDVYHPLQSGPPFDGEGVPRRRLALVESGTPRELACSRLAARRDGREPTGHGFPLPSEMGEAPVNIVFAGGDQTLDRVIAGTKRGVLATRLWYIREVDPYEKIMTGMTRDGTFLIEDGRVVCGLKNLRFNQSVIEMLRNIEALSPAERAAGEESFDMVVPALQVRDFHFSEVTRF